MGSLLKVENAVLIATRSPARWTAYSSDLDGFGRDGEQLLESADFQISRVGPLAVWQLAGNANHAGIGSDLDGGCGTEQSPHDLAAIADLQKIGDLLCNRGYKEADVEKIMDGNWLQLLRRALPKG